MNYGELRETFLDFFINRGHIHLSSAPLIPAGDPSMLFTTAGMVPFKGVFAGLEKRKYDRAVTIQKCFRTSDIEEVGNTLRHHTFFLMMGNFSFGDYFKESAIEYAWEFLIDVLRLEDEHLWVTVYKDDDEAERIWREEIGFPSEKIVRLDRDNFWGPAGDSGPCGPSSEIYIDLGEEFGCGKKDCKPGCDCDRYNEIWNLVFPQYIQAKDSSRSDMPEPGVDTGMGFERLAMVMQGTEDPYLTDMFRDIVLSAEEILGVDYRDNRKSLRIISDHIRALTFALSEGIMPGREGRGYVLRRLIRRALLRGWYLERAEPFLNELVKDVVDIYGDDYGELVEGVELTTSIIEKEEISFLRTIEEGFERVEGLIEDVVADGGEIVPGEEIFNLYDTYGFPYDISEEIAHRHGLEIDREGFDRALAEQRDRSREGADFTGEVGFVDLDEMLRIFKGYDKHRLETEVVDLIMDGKEVKSLGESEFGEVVLRETPFYAEAGGQVSDVGTLSFEGGEFKVDEVSVDAEGRFLHSGEVISGELEVGLEVVAQVDEERRRSIMRNHTATHLLHKALREVLGEVVKQAGSLVAPDRLRFDYTYHKPPTDEELDRIEMKVNEYILFNLPLNVRIADYKEAEEEGVIALFTEKYGDKVRIVEVEGVSAELCGGTHCERTGDIGSFYITSEEAVSAGMRRITAVTGWGAYEEFKEVEELITRLSSQLGVPKVDFERGIERLLGENEELRSEISSLKAQLSRDIVGELVGSSEEIDDITYIGQEVEGFGVDAIGSLIDGLKDRYEDKPLVVLIAERGDEKVLFVCGATDKAIGMGVKAGDVVMVASEVCGGGGGGRPDFAQAGGKNPEKLEEAFDVVRNYIRDIQD